MGGRSIACLNARDRNLLGFRRDLLTAAAYGVDQFLFVYGDEPLAGARTSELTVRTMLTEGRAYAEGLGDRDAHALRRGDRAATPAGVEAGAPTSSSCRSASPSTTSVAWRAEVGDLDLGVPVYAGVLVVPSAGMARNLSIPGLTVPPTSCGAWRRDRNAGVDAACELVLGIRDSGAFDGVHLIPVARYREVAARLERAAVQPKRVVKRPAVGLERCEGQLERVE